MPKIQFPIANKRKISKDSHYRILLGSSAIAFGIKMLGKLARYLLILLIAHKLGVNALGLFILAITILSIVSVINTLGFGILLVKYVSEFSSKSQYHLANLAYNKAVVIVLPLSILISILLYLLSPFAAEIIFKKSTLIPYLKTISLAIVPFVLLNLSFQSLRGLKKITEYALLDDLLIPFIAILFFLILFYTTIFNYQHIVSYMLSIWFVSAAGIYLWKKNIFLLYSNSPIIKPNTDQLAMLTSKNMLNKALPLMFVTTLGMTMVWTDTLMLGMLKTEYEVGLYGVAFRVAQFINIPLIAINSIAGPMFAEYYGKKDFKNLARVAQKSTRMIILISSPLFLFFFIFPHFVLGFFGTQFIEGSNAFLMLIFGQLVNAVTGSVGPILTMTDKQTQFRNIIFFSIILNFILNLILIPSFGINGAAFASMVSAIILHMTPFFLIKKYFNFYTISFKKNI